MKDIHDTSARKLPATRGELPQNLMVAIRAGEVMSNLCSKQIETTSEFLRRLDELLPKDGTRRPQTTRRGWSSTTEPFPQQT